MLASRTGTEAAVGANGAGLLRVEPIGVDHLLRELVGTAQDHSEAPLGAPRLRQAFADGLSQREKGAAVWQLHLIDAEVARVLIGVDHRPCRAGAAIPRDRKPTGAEPLGDVARRIHAQHEKGDRARSGPLQRRQPVCDLLKTGTKAGLQNIEVVTGFQRRFGEPGVGHHHGGGEVALESRQHHRRAAWLPDAHGFDQRQHLVAQAEFSHGQPQRKDATFRWRQLVEDQPLAVQIVAECSRLHNARWHGADDMAMGLGKVTAEVGFEVGLAQPGVVGQGFGGSLQLGKVVVPVFERVEQFVDLGRAAQQGAGHGGSVGLAGTTGLIAGVEQLQGFRDHRHALDRLAQILPRQVQFREQRVGQHLAQAARLGVAVIEGELLNIDPEGIAQPQQDVHRDRPLVMLDQVQISG